MSFYSDLQDTAEELISEFGKDWIIRRGLDATGAYNPSSNTTTGGTSTDYTVKGIRKEYNDYQVSEGVAERGDFKVIIEAKSLTITPDTGDELVEGSAVYQIVNVDIKKPADVVLAYELQVRYWVLI